MAASRVTAGRASNGVGCSHYLIKAREYTLYRRTRELNSLLEDHTFHRASSQNESRKILEGKKSTFRIAFSCDGAYMASAHGSHEIVAFALLPRCRMHRVLAGSTRSPWCLAFHPSCAPILASGCLGGVVRVWDLRARDDTPEQCSWSSAQAQPVSSLCFHPQSEDLLLVCVGHEVCMLTLAGSELAALQSYTVDNVLLSVRLAAYSEDATQAVMAVPNHLKGPFFPRPLSSSLLFSLHLCSVAGRAIPDIHKFVDILDHHSLTAGPDTCAVARGNLFYFSLKTTPCIKGVSLRKLSIGQVVFEKALNAIPFCVSLSPLGGLLLVTFQQQAAPCLLCHLDWPAGDLHHPASATALSAQGRELALGPEHLAKSINTAVFLPGLTGIAWGTAQGDVWLTAQY